MRKGMSRRKFVEAAAAALSGGVAANLAQAKEAGKATGKEKKSGQAVAAKPAPKPAVVAKPPDIADYATVEAHAAGEPVYAFGYTYVYGVSPDLQPSVQLQQGNSRPWTKIRPKKSWEIKSNKFGSTPAREPKTAANDDQPWLSLHLIDGDPETAWVSRGQAQPNVEPVWIRIDLPVESTIKSVALVPYPKGSSKVGQAFARQLEIKVSRDAWHWETVYENDNLPTPDPIKLQEFSFSPRLAKQIWIVGKEFPTQVINFGYCFSLGEVEVRDEAGSNLALISRGAGVTVSSTFTGYGMDRFTQEMLWPIQYDAGFKWTRVGYDLGMFTWTYVEREKGKLEVDPRADAAITEAVRNGINVIMVLDKGNWLYAPQPKKKDRTREIMDVVFDRPPEPTEGDEAYLQGYLNYVRYMVRHFKDRVRYFEVMNEWVTRPIAEYVRLAKAAIPVIREEYPEAKILAVSPPGFGPEPGRSLPYALAVEFHTACLKQGLGPLIDVLPWHPWYQADPADPAFINYAKNVREFKKLAESYGFKGEYMATEWTWVAPYPLPTNGWAMPPCLASCTELQKAKYALGLNIVHAGLDMVSLWNETFNKNLIIWAVGLLRNTFSADPIAPTQPEAVYYVLRTLCTVMDEFQPAEFPVEYSTKGDYESWLFERPGGERLLAFWKRGRAKDASDVTPTEIILPGRSVKKAIGVDLLNGREQELEVTAQGGTTVLKGMLMQDFPVVVRFS